MATDRSSISILKKRLSWMPAAIPRAVTWNVSDTSKVSHHDTHQRPMSFHGLPITSEDHKPLPPIPTTSLVNFTSNELFFTSATDAGIDTDSHFPMEVPTCSTLLSYCMLREASSTLPLRDFLNWIHERYNFHVLTTGFRRRLPHMAYLQKDHYHDLLAMEAEYDTRYADVPDGPGHLVIKAIYTTLRELRKDIDQDLLYIDRKHASMTMREFVIWAYARLQPRRRGRASRQSMLWNPHQITSSSRVVKEAIAYFGLPQFAEDRGVLSIYAKHVIFLLCGGKDWRESVRPEDELLVHHGGPSETRAYARIRGQGCGALR